MFWFKRFQVKIQNRVKVFQLKFEVDKSEHIFSIFISLS